MSLYKLDHITYTYPTRHKPSLVDLSLSIGAGEFVLVIGPSGGGKSTFVRLLAGMIPDFYGGKLTGSISFHEKPLLQQKNLVEEVGMVFQNPEKQMLAERVEKELVLGMENLGRSRPEMQKNLTDVSHLLDLGLLHDRKTASLSGGEKQRVVIGALLAMGPRVLILDEPTSQLDPRGSAAVLATLKKLHRECGYTVVLVEHRTDECFPLADRVLFIESGEVVHDEPTRDFATKVDSKYRSYLPKVTQWFAEREMSNLPLSLTDAKRRLKQHPFIRSSSDSKSFETGSTHPSNGLKVRRFAVALSHVDFAHSSRKQQFSDFTLEVPQNQLVIILGENGAGKSTLLRLIAGLLKAHTGDIRVQGKLVDTLSSVERVRSIGYLPQQSDSYLFHDTVEEELQFTLQNANLDDDRAIARTLEWFEIEKYIHHNPRDLSVGERLRVAMAAVLVSNPQLLLLDEPTRGLEPPRKQKLGRLLLQWLGAKDRTIVLVTQDVEFVAEFSDWVVLLENGQVSAQGLKTQVMTQDSMFVSHLTRLFTGVSNEVVSHPLSHFKISTELNS